MMEDQNQIHDITAYWNKHIHDLVVATNPVGSVGFFKELEAYRYDKLHYLPQLVNFTNYQGKSLLEVGCGVGIDLVRFGRAGARITGIDLSETAVALARQNIAQNGLVGDLHVMNGEDLEFPDDSFDVVYAHGVLQYTADASKMIAELYRVLKSGGEAIVMVYNKNSWLNLLSILTKVQLEHVDAPVFRKYSIGELKQLLQPFNYYKIIPERFPVKTKLHSGRKAKLFNDVFVTAFNLIPKPIVKPFGWHLMAFATK